MQVVLDGTELPAEPVARTRDKYTDIDWDDVFPRSTRNVPTTKSRGVEEYAGLENIDDMFDMIVGVAVEADSEIKELVEVGGCVDDTDSSDNEDAAEARPHGGMGLAPSFSLVARSAQPCRTNSSRLACKIVG